MRRTRVIPVLLLRGQSLYKTRRFKNPVYVGDPINAVKIFNDKGVDELAVFDIEASDIGRPPDLGYLREFAEECFIPLCYGGGIRDVRSAEAVLSIGVEKVAVNSAAIDHPEVVGEIAASCGSQSVVAAIDVKRGLIGGARVVRTSGSKEATGLEPGAWARRLAELGAGEIFLTSVDREGTGSGYDLDLIRTVSEAVDIPIIACGGAGCVPDFSAAVNAGATAVAAGQLFVFYGRHRAVLINYPATQELDAFLP